MASAVFAALVPLTVPPVILPVASTLPLTVAPERFTFPTTSTSPVILPAPVKPVDALKRFSACTFPVNTPPPNVIVPLLYILPPMLPLPATLMNRLLPINPEPAIDVDELVVTPLVPKRKNLFSSSCGVLVCALDVNAPNNKHANTRMGLLKFFLIRMLCE